MFNRAIWSILSTCIHTFFCRKHIPIQNVSAQISLQNVCLSSIILLAAGIVQNILAISFSFVCLRLRLFLFSATIPRIENIHHLTARMISCYVSLTTDSGYRYARRQLSWRSSRQHIRRVQFHIQRTGRVRITDVDTVPSARPHKRRPKERSRSACDGVHIDRGQATKSNQ